MHQSLIDPNSLNSQVDYFFNELGQIRDHQFYDKTDGPIAAES